MSKYLKEEFNKNINESIKKALILCSEAADEKDLRIFLIGGTVRDIIIDKNNFDVDIAVQGNAIDFAYYVQQKYPQLCKIKEMHEDFKTAKVLFNIEGEAIALDLASTRKESYPYPSSLPMVIEIGCDLYEDVIRRDFTVNSMALSINKDSFYLLIDYLDGYKDLMNKTLKIIHDKSFIDDPTRIIRGLKFSVRFGYTFSENTKKLMIDCIDSGQFDNLAGERIKLELKQTLNINRRECLERFIKEDIYRLIDTEIPVPANIHISAEKICNTIKNYSKFLSADKVWLIHFGALLVNLSDEKIKKISQKLYLSGQEKEILLCAANLYKNSPSLKSTQTRFEVFEYFEKKHIESILILLALNKNLKDKINLYLKELKDIKINIDGNKLIEYGLKPGPEFGQILREVLKAKINKEIETKNEELNFVKAIIKPE